jgi:hypothetical protein
MPSLRTRTIYQSIVLTSAEDAIATASASLAAASAEIDAASNDLEALSLGNLDLLALTISGQKFINNGGVLEPEP